MTNFTPILLFKGGIGGPQSFIRNFADYLERNNISFVFWPQSPSGKSVLLLSPCLSNIFLLAFKRLFIRDFIYISRLDGFFEFSLNYPFFDIIKRIYFNALTFIEAVFSAGIVFQSQYLKSKYAWMFPFSKQIVILNSFNSSLQKKFGEIPLNLSQSVSSDSPIFLFSVEGFVKHDYLDILAPKLSDYTWHIFGSSIKVQQKLDLRLYPALYFHGLVPLDSIYLKISSLIRDQKRPIFICLEPDAPCPNSVIEALSLGIPVIGSSEGSIPELIGNAGHHFDFSMPPSDLKSHLTHAIIDIQSNYIRYSSNAFHRAISQNNPNTIFDQYLDFFERSF